MLNSKLLIIVILCLVGVLVAQPVTANPAHPDNANYKQLYLEALLKIDELQDTLIEYETRRPVKQWESLEQFEGWYESNLTHLMPSGSYKVDCDDYAERMQLKALVEGYPLSSHLVINGYILDKHIPDVDKLHMGNLVMIGSEIYYVESIPEHFKIIKVCDRD